MNPTFNDNLPDGLPMSAYLGPEEREKFLRTFDRIWREHLGDERYEAYRITTLVPPWLAKIPGLPERDEIGLLPVKN